MLLALPLVVLAALLIGAGPRSSLPSGGEAEQPVSTLAEQLSDGLIEIQVYKLDNLTYQIEVQFTPAPDSTISPSTKPEISLSMESMHMDGFDPPLENVDTGNWRSRGILPMAGKWILSVGFGEEFGELTFGTD